ncbi:MAG: hypothetical protein AAGI63_07920 [Planctomycetota bacterium]
MVQIERAEEVDTETAAPQQMAVGGASVDSQAITQESIAGDPDAESSVVSDAHGFTGESSSATDSSVPPDWQSARTRRTRQVALVSLVSVTGLMAAIVVFTWFVKSFREEPIAQNSNQPGVNAAEDAQPSEAETIESESNEEADDTVDPVTAEPAESEAAESEATETDTGAAESENIQPVIPTDLMPESPLGGPIIPIEPDTSLMPQDPLAADPETEIAGMEDLTPELKKYLRFLPDEGQVEATNLPAPPTMDDVKIEGAAEQNFNFLGRPEPREINLKSDFGIRMALASEGYPLVDLTLLVSQATSVPIQVDWVSFDLAGIDVSKPIETVKGWQTARDILDSIGSRLGAEVREEKTLVIFTLTDDSFQQTIDSLSDFTDFGDGKTSAIRVLNTFLGANPEQPALAIGVDREQRQLAGLAIEGLRRMRGVEPKVPDPALRHWAGPMGQSVEWPVVVGGQTGPQQDSPITLASLLRRTSRLNQSTCIVNWYDVTSRGASPEWTLIPHAKQDAATMLTKAMEPFQLQVRTVDGSHWWVGSESTYDRLTAVVWTPPLGASKDEFLQRIQTIMQGATPEMFRMAYDQDSDRALLLLPRFIVRQLPKIAPEKVVKN